MSCADRLTHLHFPKLGVKGAHVELSTSLLDLPGYRAYPPRAQSHLGQALAAAALLHANVKGRSSISLQLQSRSTLGLLYAECTELGALRGLARLRAESDAPELSQLGADSVLAINLNSSAEPQRSGTRYQGLVPLVGARLDAALEHYFEASEQLPTQILLSANQDRACGLLLQRLPQSDQSDLDDDGWTRTSMLMGTVTASELLESERDALLYRVFHDEQLAIVDGLQLHFACSCSRERVEAMFQGLGREESLLAANDRGRASVKCEFCSHDYEFDRVDLEALFHPLVQPPSAAQ